MRGLSVFRSRLFSLLLLLLLLLLPHTKGLLETPFFSRFSRDFRFDSRDQRTRTHWEGGGQTQQTHTVYTLLYTQVHTHTRARKTDVLKYIRMLGHPVFGVGSDGTEHTERLKTRTLTTGQARIIKSSNSRTGLITFVA
uniref:Putative secreted protein n=1 Tax=Anopheles darlingi TaxID=43151 RepID=A0A2M4D7T9_ANODA